MYSRTVPCTSSEVPDATFVCSRSCGSLQLSASGPDGISVSAFLGNPVTSFPAPVDASLAAVLRCGDATAPNSATTTSSLEECAY